MPQPWTRPDSERCVSPTQSGMRRCWKPRLAGSDKCEQHAALTLTEADQIDPRIAERMRAVLED